MSRPAEEGCAIEHRAVFFFIVPFAKNFPPAR
jgi:hypothetical protein